MLLRSSSSGPAFLFSPTRSSPQRSATNIQWICSDVISAFCVLKKNGKLPMTYSLCRSFLLKAASLITQELLPTLLSCYFFLIKSNQKSRKERCFPPQAQAGPPFFSALRSGLRNDGLQAFNGIAFERMSLTPSVFEKNPLLPMT